MRTPMQPRTQLLLGCAIAFVSVSLFVAICVALFAESLKSGETVGGKGVVEVTSPATLREELTVECEWNWRIPPTVGHIDLDSSLSLGDGYVLWVELVLPDVEAPEIEGNLYFARTPTPQGVFGWVDLALSEVALREYGRSGSAAFAASEYRFDDGTGRVVPPISGRVTWACNGGPRLQPRF